MKLLLISFLFVSCQTLSLSELVDKCEHIDITDHRTKLTCTKWNPYQ